MQKEKRKRSREEGNNNNNVAPLATTCCPLNPKTTIVHQGWRESWKKIMKSEHHRLLLLLSTFLFKFDFAATAVACFSDDVCIQKLRVGSTCVDGFCTNPFVSGCLRGYFGEEEFPTLRVCNSDDPPEYEEAGICTREPLKYLDYTEIRVAPGNWESTIFIAWLYQILLTELMNVPVSIERGEGRGPDMPSLSFYDVTNSYTEAYPVAAYPIDTIPKSNEVDGDCEQTEEPCAHLLPEVWPGTGLHPGTADIFFNGMVGLEGFWMPRHTIERDPSLGNIFGLSGELNREKLARTFKRPTTWKEYCTLVSNCTSDDGVAVRAPLDDIEGNKYYEEEMYIGHFRDTEKNDCVRNPNCTGHVVDYPCYWGANTEQQMHWNGIFLEAENGNEHYTVASLGEIFFAANATQSDIMTLWWKPEPTLDQFDYFQVTFPFPTRECIDNRRPTVDRCGLSQEELLGSPEGACTRESLPLEKAIANSVQERSLNTPLDARSPAYQFMSRFTIKNIQIEEILKNWNKRNIDKHGYDPREAVCDYVARNLVQLLVVGLIKDALIAVVPPGYPREVGDIKEDSYYSDALTIIAVTLAAASGVLMIATFCGTFIYRENKVMKEGQIQFLYLFCLGYLLTSAGAVTNAMSPTNSVCIATQWFVVIGYTFALVPLAVKLSAINRLLRQARMLRRHKISTRELFMWVGLLFLLPLIFLTVWTIVDPPSKQLDVVLRDNTENIVDVHVSCSTSHKFWGGMALGWEGILIFYSFVLAWNARRHSKMKKISELQMARNMAYVSFMVFVFRSVVYYLPDEAVKPQTRAGAESVLLSMDAMLSILVYFGPKFFLIWHPESASTRRESTIGNSNSFLGAVECVHCHRQFVPATTFESVRATSISGLASIQTEQRQEQFPALSSLDNDLTRSSIPEERTMYSSEQSDEKQDCSTNELDNSAGEDQSVARSIDHAGRVLPLED